MKKLLIFSALVYLSLHADIQVGSTQSFERAMMRSPLAVVIFYRDTNISPSEKMRTLALLKRLHLIEDATKRYVTFVLINVDKSTVLAQQFNIAQVPTVVLFRNGRPFMKNGKVISVAGYPSGSYLIQMIEDNFDEFIEQMSKERREYELYREQMKAAMGWINAWQPYPLYHWDRFFWPARAYYDPGFRSGPWL